jgi:drug/metabolite transporter (DMT)-like permease
MTKILIILFIAFTFEALGIIELKRGLDQIGASYRARAGAVPLWRNVLRLVGEWFTNRHVLVGLALEIVFFVLLQYLLGQREVSFVWPLTALSFVMTTLAAQFLLREQVSPIRWTGVALIVAGAACISWSEHRRPEPSPKAPAPTVHQP